MTPSSARSARIQQMFSRIARRYDLMNRLMTGGQDEAWRRLAVSELRLPQGGCCLDLATGTGDLALAVRFAYPSAQVVGVDFAFNMLDIGRQKLRSRGELQTPSLAHRHADDYALWPPQGERPPQNAATRTLGSRFRATGQWPGPGNKGERPSAGGQGVFLAQGDALDLPFVDAQFDGLVNGFLLRNVVDLPRALAEMRRVVKPGGRVVSLEITRPRTPVFRQLFQLYFYRLVPLVGGIIAGDLQAYTYLPNSLTNFPDAQALKGLMLQAGYRHVDVRLLSLGAMALHVAEV